MPCTPHGRTKSAASNGIGQPRAGSAVIFHDEPSARAYAASRSGDHRVLAVSVTEFVMGELGSRRPVAWYRDGQLQDQRAQRPGALYPVEPWSEAARS